MRCKAPALLGRDRCLTACTEIFSPTDDIITDPPGWETSIANPRSERSERRKVGETQYDISAYPPRIRGNRTC